MKKHRKLIDVQEIETLELIAKKNKMKLKPFIELVLSNLAKEYINATDIMSNWNGKENYFYYEDRVVDWNEIAELQETIDNIESYGKEDK